jgi:2-dehydropantoate 2-reductase
MRILILGAGAVGGYFGGRLVEKGEDVTFLVRPKRKQQLNENGLVTHSTHGDFSAPVQTLSPGDHAEPFDLIILGVKAYHLEQALPSLTPYVGENTAILPLLNGITHLQVLKETFGEEKVLGGLCFIETTLNEKGEIEQYSSAHDLVFGELDGTDSPRVKRILSHLSGTRAKVRTSDHILREMWNKYIFISTFSGITSLMKSSIGPILDAPYGKEVTRRLLSEIVTIAKTQQSDLDEKIEEKVFAILQQIEPTMKSSMLRDTEKGHAVEADHLQGSLIQMAPEGMDLPMLKTVYNALKVYERNRY